MSKIVVTGSVSTQEKALDWLKAHGAIIEHALGLDIIQLPEKAMLEKDGYEWRYSITFYDASGNTEETYVEMEMYADASETVLRLIIED